MARFSVVALIVLVAPAFLLSQSLTAGDSQPTSPATAVDSLFGFCTEIPCASGAEPVGSALQAYDGDFYGVTAIGGLYGQGTFYRLSLAGKFTVLYSFNAVIDGGAPLAGIIQASDGNFYGAQLGSISKLTATGQITNIHIFGVEGSDPIGNLVQSSDGDLYGMTSEGAEFASGSLFKISLDGTFSDLLTLPAGFFFRSGGAPGPSGRSGGLLESTDGKYYGTTYAGAAGFGSLFAYDSNTQKLQILYSFSGGPDGAYANAGLVQVADGSLYGTTSYGGDDSLCSSGGPPAPEIFGCGVLFKFYPGFQNSLTLEHTFVGYADGLNPLSAPTLGSDGNLYGTTASPGSIFSYSMTGNFEPLYVFGCVEDPNFSCPVGFNPNAGLLQADDGQFYGVALFGGGPTGGGDIFRVGLSPALKAPLTVSAPLIAQVDEPVTVTFDLLNGFSATMRQCYGFATNNSTSVFYPLGKVSGEQSTTSYHGSFVTTLVTPGAYSLAVTCGGIESANATVNVLTGLRYPTTLTLAATPATVAKGGNVLLKTQVSRAGEAWTPTGVVQFYVGNLDLGESPIDEDGQAILNVSTKGVRSNDYPVRATYIGDSGHSASSSNTVIVRVGLGPTTTVLLPPGQSNGVNFLVSDGNHPISGSIGFYSGSTLINTFTLDSGRGSVFYSELFSVLGTYKLSARYNGNGSEQPSVSNTVTAVVTAVDLQNHDSGSESASWK